MSGIPIGETAFAGFGVIARKPLAVLVWGLVLFVLTVLPLMAAFSLIAPTFGQMFTEAAQGAEPSVETALAFQLQMMALNPLLMIPSLLSRVLLTCAIYRAVLQPEDDRFFYLRLGMTEVLVGVVLLALGLGLGILAVVGILIGAGVTVATWAASEAAGFGVAVLLVLALLGGIVWLCLRLSMAMPMTFADRKFRFFESWALTRGHVLSLFLVGLLMVAILWLLEMVIAGVVAAVAIPFIVSRPFDEAALMAFFSQPVEVWAAALAPWVLLGGLVFSVVGAVFYAVMMAPWAAAYRALAAKAPAEAASPA